MKECYYHLWLGRCDTEKAFEEYLFPKNGLCEFLKELGYTAQEEALFRNNGKMETLFPYLKTTFPLDELLKNSPVKPSDLELIKKRIEKLNLFEPNTYITLIDDNLHLETERKFGNYYYFGYFQMDSNHLKIRKITFPNSFEQFLDDFFLNKQED